MKPDYKLSDSTYWFLILHKWLVYICHVVGAANSFGTELLLVFL